MSTIKTKFKEFWSNVWKVLKVPINAFLVAIGAFILVYLIKLYHGAPSTFLQYGSLIIASIAAIFAGYSAVLASRALQKTEEALELTRYTARPFLALQPGHSSASVRGHIVTSVSQIKNTGSIPANLTTAEMAFFDDDEEITEDNESKEYPKESQQPRDVVVFPNAAYSLVHRLDLRREIDKKLFENMKNGKVKLRFRMIYRGQGTEYVTTQTEKIGKEEAGEMERSPIQPQSWT